MNNRSAQRLLIFLPPRLGAGGRAQFGSGTVVPYVALSARESTRGEAPVALLPKAGAVDLVFDSGDVFITAIESPKLSEGRLRMALPNILEDRLLGGRDRLSFRVQRSARRHRYHDDCCATEDASRGYRSRHPDACA